MSSKATRIILFSLAFTSLLLIAAAWFALGFTRELLFELGVGLVGAVITFTIFEIYLADMHKAEGEQKKGIDYDQFIKNVRNARRQIRILTTYTYLLSSDRIRHEFREALSFSIRHRDNLRIQFLLLDPLSDAAEQRHADRPNENVIDRIKSNLLVLNELKQDLVYRRVEVRVYHALPPISLFQVDDRGSMSFYPRGQAISEADRFEFSMATPVGKFVNLTFDALWGDRTTKTLEDYMLVRVLVENPLTKQTEYFQVHFVVGATADAFYLLMNMHHDKWAWGLPLADGQSVSLRIGWQDSELECTCSEVARLDVAEASQFEHIFSSAVAKYGRYDFHKVVEARPIMPALAHVAQRE